ncbi:MAG: T9SS type A sorting domain-containing protein [Paludibacteraceae bacterium]|nr:T9SS type A sorting domain-containing protein [Paludibacteraceae bacterium]
MKRLAYIFTLLTLTLSVSAQTWTTHLAYNSVNQIAVGGGFAYAVSSGSLLAVDVQTEKIRTYSSQDGMHGHDIACIKWLEPAQALMIVYSNSKIDILKNGTFQYIPDLYDKYTPLSKYCHSITVRDSLAYLAMDYGVQTFHIRKREFVNTYFIGPEGKEVPVNHIAVTNQVIYAAGDTTLYAATLTDNIVDYSYWSEIPLPDKGYIQGIAQAGGILYLLQNNTCYRRQGQQWRLYNNNSYYSLNIVDGKIYPADYPTTSHDGELWTAAGEQGIIRRMVTGETVTYKLDGPLNNLPYRLHFGQDQLFMLAGGRWAVQNNRPGCVMRYDGSSWHNITNEEIVRQVGGLCIDFMNAAVDPKDPTHYFITSYGSGLYEFRNDQCIKRWNASNSIIGSAAADNPAKYTRLDGAIYDAQANLWMMNTGNIEYNIVIFAADGSQIGMNVQNEDGSRFIINTAGQFIFDNCHANRVWALVPRGNEKEAGLALIDTKGTLPDTDDDRTLIRIHWTDQDGNSLTRSAIYSMRQDKQGNIWLATNNGVLIIPVSEDYFSSNKCQVLHVTNNEDLPIFDEEKINDILFDHLNRAWIATQTAGVYVLSADDYSILEHYSVDNSAMPSNNVLSLAYDDLHKRMYIGTSLGLVSVTDRTSDVNAEQSSYSEPADMGSMMQWTTHLAYADINDIQLSTTRVYALSEGSLCAIDRDDESLTYYSKLNGLNGSSISRIGYDSHTATLIIAYDDGMIDLLDDQGAIHSVADIYLKQINAKQVQNIAFRDGKAYLAMPFGIVVINIRKQEISDTYYIGDEGSELSINAIAVVGDSIFAAADNRLFRGNIKDNLVDYAKWHSTSMPATITHLISNDNDLYMLMDSVIYRNGQIIPASNKFVALSAYKGSILARTDDRRIFTVAGTTLTEQSNLAAYKPQCAVRDGNTYWLGTNEGVLHIMDDNSVQKYEPDGPLSNMPYDMVTYGSQLWIVPGGRWATEFKREAQIMYYNGAQWDNLSYNDICRRIGATLSLADLVHVAVDPADSKHFYAASYGMGVVEFLPDGTAKRYTYNNSPLRSADTGNAMYRYCRVDAMTFDADRNLWLTNMSDLATNVHIITPDHQWHSFNLYQGGQRIVLNTVSKFVVDNRNPDYKWIASARDAAGVILINDNGTPYTNYDDRVVSRSTFVDQDNKSITLASLKTIAQDHNGDMWLGTNEGILVIEAATDLFRSNSCRRLKMSRHDGTNLADYLLGTEQINSIVFAGGNRIWIGTNVSGAYLVHMVTKEGIYEPEIISHFTTLNSPMPSDCVLSIAINEENGEVYIGTSKGLVSYRGDASAPSDSFANAYVYPNPVRPNYEGIITINGLMDNTTVYIADAAGNVVCRTHSEGGTAVWDGKTLAGSKAHSGVYTIYCNTADGKNHTTLKVLIMH